MKRTLLILFVDCKMGLENQIPHLIALAESGVITDWNKKIFNKIKQFEKLSRLFLIGKIEKEKIHKFYEAIRRESE